MKKVIIFTTLGIIILLGIIGLLFNKKQKTELRKITVAEVTHSAFYAPWYVALEEGYFKEAGLDVEVILTPGADKTAAAVLSEDAEIGFSGPEATIYIYNNGEENYLKTFAALTKRDGQFLVGNCKEKDNFKIENLLGKSILAGRKGGMPLMVFSYAIKESGIKIDKINIDSSIEFAALSGAYIGGSGDYVNLFEPTALNIEKQGYGCVLTSIGMLAGELPYTAYYAKSSFIEDNKEILSSFNTALNKGLTFVHKNDSKTIAEKIVHQFPDITISDLTKVIQRYKEADSWWKNTYINKNSFERLQDLMIYNKAIEKKVEFENLVTNEFNE